MEKRLTDVAFFADIPLGASITEAVMTLEAAVQMLVEVINNLAERVAKIETLMEEFDV